MATSISLNNYTLPLPAAYIESDGYRVAHHVGIDAMVSVDTRTGATLTYRDVTITWDDLTLSELKTVRSAWQDLTELGQVPFVDPLGVSRTAEIMPEGKAFDPIGYAGTKGNDGVYEALFQVTFQIRLTP